MKKPEGELEEAAKALLYCIKLIALGFATLDLAMWLITGIAPWNL